MGCGYGRVSSEEDKRETEAYKKMIAKKERASRASNLQTVICLLIPLFAIIIAGLVLFMKEVNSGPSLFCFALIMSDSYEVALLRKQHDRGVGLFTCDGSRVYSDKAVQLSDREYVRAHVLPGPLRVGRDPTYNFALNARVFLRLWQRVWQDVEFMQFEWTIKVDADTVFLPGRLRDHLRKGPAATRSVIYVNCRFGMHGPIEVLSRVAVQDYRDGLDRCTDERGPQLDMEGEDIWMGHCMELLGVIQQQDYDMLAEKACMENPFPCYSGKVAFHPLKRADKYFECLDQAER